MRSLFCQNNFEIFRNLVKLRCAVSSTAFSVQEKLLRDVAKQTIKVFAHLDHRGEHEWVEVSVVLLPFRLLASLVALWLLELRVINVYHFPFTVSDQKLYNEVGLELSQILNHLGTEAQKLITEFLFVRKHLMDPLFELIFNQLTGSLKDFLH